MGEDDTDQG